eukprot:CAMPEP_0204068516 /NCGR_PEP_ID=MMETSP0360-20130528/155407_1 /ASSEMBLY_ACC=CAM_ASM_000342 /TAXON_ID=268821 /ORGANISM="Scrippsiella Hangoei, Strain SHTV-5" /LENGTH=56 /DNA_ID=CAMNT_0051016649 /DNA_START=33 /DNA_END=204 /DNA_ORIENTATION=+
MEQSAARLKAMERATLPELPAAVTAQFAQLSLMPQQRRLQPGLAPGWHDPVPKAGT